MRWFGSPWPLPEERAPVCDEAYRVEAPVGKKCLYCPEPIAEGDRGVVVGSSPEVSGRFVLTLTDPDTQEARSVYVVASHLGCFLGAIGGPELEGLHV